MLPIATITTKAQSPDDVGLFGAGTGLVAASKEALGRFKIEVQKSRSPDETYRSLVGHFGEVFGDF